MGGILQVDTIQNNNATTLITQTNTTTLTFGVSGQNIIIPSGVTFNTASATVTVPPSIITGQTAETSVAGGDLVLVYDDSATALRKMTKTNLFSGVAVNGPAFSAYAGAATTIPNNVVTKVLFNTEEYDTNNNFASSTFTPTIAGYYFINSVINTSIYIGGNAQLQIYKNGSGFKLGEQSGNFGNQAGLSVSALIYMNGTTDNLEIYAYQAIGASANTSTGSTVTYFQGYLARVA